MLHLFTDIIYPDDLNSLQGLNQLMKHEKPNQTHTHKCTHTPTHMHKHVCTHPYTYACTHVYTCTYAHMHTHTHTHTHACMHTCRRTHTHTHTHTYTDMHACMHTCTHVHTHTLTHTHKNNNKKQLATWTNNALDPYLWLLLCGWQVLLMLNLDWETNKANIVNLHSELTATKSGLHSK